MRRESTLHAAGSRWRYSQRQLTRAAPAANGRPPHSTSGSRARAVAIWPKMAKGGRFRELFGVCRADLRLFAEFSQRQQLAFLPATPDTVHTFVLERAAGGRNASLLAKQARCSLTIQIVGVDDQP